LTDGYLVTLEKDTKAAQFFSFASRLPLDLQMVLCNRVIGLAAENISPRLMERSTAWHFSAFGS